MTYCHCGVPIELGYKECAGCENEHFDKGDDMTYNRGIEVPCDRCGRDHPSETARRWGMCDECREVVMRDRHPSERIMGGDDGLSV
jgi:hypothetical protein